VGRSFASWPSALRWARGRPAASRSVTTSSRSANRVACCTPPATRQRPGGNRDGARIPRAPVAGGGASHLRPRRRPHGRPVTGSPVASPARFRRRPDHGRGSRPRVADPPRIARRVAVQTAALGAARASLQGGRVEAIAAAGPGSSTFYVGPGGGNVWKTTNNGMTFEPVFEHESAFRHRRHCRRASNPNVVWVGTGEVQPRHSGPRLPAPGLQVGGRGPDVAADGPRRHAPHRQDRHRRERPRHRLRGRDGHSWSPNTERGVFKTTDGGATWTRSLHVDDRTGAIDLVMDPSDPKVLYASLWQIASGPASGIYKTVDAAGPGRSWGTGCRPGRSAAATSMSPAAIRAWSTRFWTTPPPGCSAGGRRAGAPDDRREVYRSDDKGRAGAGPTRTTFTRSSASTAGSSATSAWRRTTRTRSTSSATGCTTRPTAAGPTLASARPSGASTRSPAPPCTSTTTSCGSTPRTRRG